ncbi:MAG: helix-turn-helix domain-containing protein [Candidatus Competibacteraceae bacterium]|nr:helix-turn-helix domain-containing protein [Candidatus Competibacteraceae bacterium]
MSIAAALFSESQSRLFRWLFGQPERRFHLNELRRLTGLGSASLQRELRKLTEAGLVSSERVGNLRCFQANPQSPVFSELTALTRKTLGIELLLRESLTNLQPRLHAAWIYGSIARQTDTAQSDIDVMLVGENLMLGDVLECLLPLETELGRKINPTCYAPDEFARRRAEPDSFVNRVLAQPIIPLIGTPDEFAGA